MTGNEFGEIRTACGLTKAALARRWGVTSRMIYSIEAGASVSARHADAIRFVAIEEGVQRVAQYLDPK